MNKAQVKSVLSFQKKIVDLIPFYPALHKAWIGKDGMQIVADNFRAIRFIEHVDGIAQHGDYRPEEWRKEQDAVEKFIADALENSNEYMPGVTDTALREHIKSADAPKTKDTGRPIWKFGDNLPWVDANYLLDILRIVPDARFAKPKNNHSPIYFNGKNGEGIMCPVRQN